MTVERAHRPVFHEIRSHPSMAKPLTKQETIDRLRAIAAKRGPVSAEWLARHANAVWRGALRHFEGLPAARKAAGVPGPRSRVKWSRDRVLRELRVAWLAGIRITATGLIEAGRYDLIGGAIRNGGLARMRKAARIPDPPRNKLGGREPRWSWDDERVISEIRALHRRGKSLAQSKVSLSLLTAGRRFFGSWRNAIEAAGFDYDDIRLRRRYTREQIRAELRKLRAKRPHASMSDLHRLPFSKTMKQLYGSITNALDAAGIVGWPVPERRRWSRKDVLVALRAYADRGVPAGALAQAAQKYFGSIAAAREAAGLPRLRTAWSEQVVIQKLRGLAARGVYTPDPNLREACIRIFGGVREAREAAGIERPPRRARKSTHRRPTPKSREETLAPTRVSANTRRRRVGATALNGRLRQRRHDMREVRAQVEALALARPNMTASELYRHPLGRIMIRRLGSVKVTLLLWGIRDWPKRLVDRGSRSRTDLAATR